MKFCYDSPHDAVFLRTLAWEIFVARREPTVGEVAGGEVQYARRELGLAEFEQDAGAARDFLQKLRKSPVPKLSDAYEPPKPIEPGWENEWRLLYLPSHRQVRQLSNSPVYRDQTPSGALHKEYVLTLRDSAVPTLRIYAGDSTSAGKACAAKRGVYMLRLADSLYIGKSDEFNVRGQHHVGSKKPQWSVFFTLEYDEPNLTLDTLAAAESLLISFWNEISVLDNQTRGGDRKPAQPYLQQAILLTKGVSAAFVWLAREQPNFAIPFKKWKGQRWPKCYLEVPES